MKTIALLITLSFLLSLGTGVLAQKTELPSPGLTPDSPFYFLETIVEEIGTFFAFGDLKKAERYANLAAERLVEAQAVAEKGKTELAEKTLQRYESQLNNSIARAEKAQAEGKNTKKVMEVLTKVGQATSKHLDVLANIYEKVPEQAKPAVEDAMKVSLKGHEKAVEVLKTQNALGDIPEEVSLPEMVSQEVRERLQQELEIEKILEGVDTSKSLRETCQDQGGTPEMCEQFPLEKFESFEQIETFCTEKGGTQEICSSLEDKCREFGVTEPNECFILLSVASIKTYQSTELKISPAPTSTEVSEQVIMPTQTEESSGQVQQEPASPLISSTSKVIIYSIPTCPHCTDAKVWLQQHNIQYEEIDISQNQTAQDELIKKAGQVIVPVIDVDGEILVGFSQESFSEFFGVE